MTEQDRPSVYDWPGMATDLIERALRSPNYGNSGHQSLSGAFAREGIPPVTVTCTIDIPERTFRLLHLAISLMGQRGTLPPDDLLKQILELFNKNPPYTYKSASGLLHCLWPFPWTDQGAHNYIGLMLKSLGRIEAAETAYREAIRLDPTFALAKNNLSVILLERGRHLEAETESLEAIRLKPDYPEAHINLGNVLAQRGRHLEAEKEYREAIRLDPDLAEAHYNLAQHYYDQKRFEEARAEYCEAIRAKADYAEALGNLAALLDELGHGHQAREFWERALKTEKDPEWIRKIRNRLALPD